MIYTGFDFIDLHKLSNRLEIILKIDTFHIKLTISTNTIKTSCFLITVSTLTQIVSCHFVTLG